MVKTGLPGMAYVKLDSKAQWPDNLAVRLPEPGSLGGQSSGEAR
jgi:hypothetical protein